MTQVPPIDYESPCLPRSKRLVVVLSTLLSFAALACPSQAQGQPSGRQLTQGPQLQRQSQVRIALVIGNGSYQNAKPLRNPQNDAKLTAAAMRELGFEVFTGVDKSQREMRQLIRDFGQRLRASGGVGVFFYAGHGVQAKGHNYLVPVEADIQTESDLEDQAVDVNYVLNLMDEAQNSLNIVILDACRNNPFVRSFRSTQEGLAQIRAPSGTLIAYATAPDSVAADGQGTNSPYTEELLKQMRTPGVLIETMFRRVTEQVSSRTGGRQEPWFSANIKGDFYFRDGPRVSGVSSPIESRPEQISTKLDPAAFELSFWDSIKSSNDPENFKAYLDRYPNGLFAPLARNNLRRLEALNNSGGAAKPSVSEGSDIARKNADIEEKNLKIEEANKTISDTFKAGNAALLAKDYDEAIRQYDIGLAADPDHPGASSLLTNKSSALKARGVARYNEAIQSREDAVRKSGINAAKGDFKAAVDAATQAVYLLKKPPAPTDLNEQKQLATNQYFAMSARAEAMRLFVGKFDATKTNDAIVAFQEYMAIETDESKKTKAHHDMAQMLLDAGAGDKAFVEFQKILAERPDDLDAYLGAGLALFSTGDKAKYHEASNYLQKFVDKAPDTHKFKSDAKAVLAELNSSENIVPGKTTKPGTRKRP